MNRDKSKHVAPTGAKSDRKEKTLCISNKGPYNKNNPRYCVNCKRPLSKNEVGKRKCDGPAD